MHSLFSYIITVGPLVLFLLSLLFFWRASSSREEGREEIKRARKGLQDERYINESFLERDREILNEEREKLTLQEKRLNRERALSAIATRNQALEEAKEAQKQAFDEEQEAKKTAFEESLKKEKELHKKALEESLRKEREAHEKALKEKKEIQDKIFEEKTIGFPWMAEMYAMYKTSMYDVAKDKLRFKSRPALKAVEEVRELKERTKEAEKKYFITLGLLKYYENLFPSLTDYQEAPDDVTQKVDSTNLHQEKDPAQAFLSHEEWDVYSSTEKFQRALDKYCKRKKSNWEIGREFERYIGYQYEVDGWDVDYFGAKKGLEDLGRDLIAKKGHQIHVVQCKYWAKGKIIHEKHIFQLYGTSVVYAIENNLKTPPLPVFISSCQVSEIAQKAADRLGVRLRTDMVMEDYPRIKCNIGKDYAKIYHLPFDQQYDKIRIEPKKGEFYCMTVAEAEQAHFRRAYRWRGGN